MIPTHAWRWWSGFKLEIVNAGRDTVFAVRRTGFRDPKVDRNLFDPFDALKLKGSAAENLCFRKNKDCGDDLLDVVSGLERFFNTVLQRSLRILALNYVWMGVADLFGSAPCEL